MLKSLLVENYALIDSLYIEFDDGFSVITGETGAGKSIILGAIGLLLGQRADTKSIKEGESKCIIEGVFNINGYELKDFFEANELDYDENCIIRREILSTGKSRSFINDTPINILILKDLGYRLIDVHSQHENLLISNKSFQFNIVDTVAKTQSDVNEFQKDFQMYKKLLEKIESLKQTAEKEKTDQDYYQFQLDQIEEARLLSDSEQEELESEQQLLTHTEEIKTILAKIDSIFSEEDRGVISSLKEVKKSLNNLAALYAKMQEVDERFSSCYFEFLDLSNEISQHQNDLDFSQEKLLMVNERLDLIYTLEQKHHVKTIADLLKIKADLEGKLQQISSFDEELMELEKEKTILLKKLQDKALALSVKRKEIVPKIEKNICENLSQLGMPEVQFKVHITETQDLMITGLNQIEFLFASNQHITPQPMSKIASGGEVSRVMLCVKSLISNQKDIPTIIFDEIDTGVSGDIADKMGDIMQDMGQQMQVISITHLPQIAAKGKAQYKVFKTDKGKFLGTQIKKLNIEDRVIEIAQMLSGATLSDAAIKNAEVLLKQHLE